MRTLLALAAITMCTTLPGLADDVKDNAIARCPMGGAYHGRGGPRECSKFGQLDLSDEQNEKLFQLRQKFADQIGMTKAEMRKERRKMRDLLTQPTIDRKAVEATQAKLNTFKTSLSNAKLAFKLDASEILTAEQRKQLRYGQGSSWHKGGGIKVGEFDDESTLLSLLPEMDLDSLESN